LFAEIDHHEVVNVACGGMTSLNDLWKMIAAALDVKVNAKHGPTRTGDIKHSLASVEKAKKLFGYEPVIQMKEGMEKTIGWAKMKVEF
jgi:nucleoside-diphosphate-sugar epimerase